MTTYTAQCQCGGLRLACEGEPWRVSLCCCKACQRRTGAPYGVGAYFKAEQVSVEGAAKTFARTSDAGRWLKQYFCPECGSAVYWEMELRPATFGVAFGAFDHPGPWTPMAAVWTDHKAVWVPLPPNVPALAKQC